MPDPDDREPATDNDEKQPPTEDPTGLDLLPDADPEQTDGAKYAKDGKVNFGEDMLP